MWKEGHDWLEVAMSSGAKTPVEKIPNFIRTKWGEVTTNAYSTSYDM